MRLLNLTTLQLEEFFDASIPPYFILSHRWGDDEMSYQDVATLPLSQLRRKKSWPKLEGFMRVAQESDSESEGQTANEHRPGHVWVDTFCIDKTSSAELSEAINSMFKWYRDARLCVAFLADVAVDERSLRRSDEGTRQFCGSEWFTRGWTLQELLAPAKVHFFNGRWDKIGEKAQLTDLLSRSTGIEAWVLESSGQQHKRTSAATRMRWASQRRTSRVEDMAYCLLGIFDINMPLLYGEGNRAFYRLQEAILLQQGDYSLFLWSEPDLDTRLSTGRQGPFAPDASLFSSTPAHDLLYRPNKVSLWADEGTHRMIELPPLVNRNGIQLPMSLVRIRRQALDTSLLFPLLSTDKRYRGVFMGVLPCRPHLNPRYLLAIPLLWLGSANGFKLMDRTWYLPAAMLPRFVCRIGGFFAVDPRRKSPRSELVRIQPPLTVREMVLESSMLSFEVVLPPELASAVELSTTPESSAVARSCRVTRFALPGRNEGVRLHLRRRDGGCRQVSIVFPERNGQALCVQDGDGAGGRENLTGWHDLRPGEVGRRIFVFVVDGVKYSARLESCVGHGGVSGVCEIRKCTIMEGITGVLLSGGAERIPRL